MRHIPLLLSLCGSINPFSSVHNIWFVSFRNRMMINTQAAVHLLIPLSPLPPFWPSNLLFQLCRIWLSFTFLVSKPLLLTHPFEVACQSTSIAIVPLWLQASLPLATHLVHLPLAFSSSNFGIVVCCLPYQTLSSWLSPCSCKLTLLKTRLTHVTSPAREISLKWAPSLSMTL